MFVYGAPLEVPRHSDRAAMERSREALERALLDLTDRAESLAVRPGDGAGEASDR